MAATTWFVDARNGSNGYSGLSPSAPKRTIRAVVKQSVADESLDASKGATFAVSGDGPVLTTAATKPGLTYTLREGATLGTLSDGDTKQGDGQPWTPTLTVKGGTSGFYRIKVGK